LSDTSTTRKYLKAWNGKIEVAGSTGVRNTLSFCQKMVCVQWLIEGESTVPMPRGGDVDRWQKAQQIIA